MIAAPALRLTAQGEELDLSPEAWGTLRRSEDIADDALALQARMAEDGYLFLPGYLNRDNVLAARHETLLRLSHAGALAEGFDPMEGVAPTTGEKRYFMPQLALDNIPLLNLLYGEDMMGFFEQFYGAPVRHYDYTWMRTVTPGGGTAPHCDIVYMGRGTNQLLTAWTPLGDISYEMGGLMVLENSHNNARLRANYGTRDVDTYCENHRDIRSSGSSTFGALSKTPVRLRERLGGRWLSSEFRMGDLLTFSMYTVHASLDNQSNRIRVSSDSRYQPAHLPADERWVNGPQGEKPIGHGEAARQSRIC